MGMKKVCLIANYNQYESKRYFTQQLAAALERKGVETDIIDVEQRAFDVEEVKRVKNFHPDVTCSFNSLLRMSNEQYLWDFMGIPHLSIILDPVLYSLDYTHSPLSLLSCVDRSDQAALQSMGFTSSFFWPHAASPDIATAPEGDRPYEVVFIGSCYDYESLRADWQENLSASEMKVLDHAIELFTGDRFISLSEALSQACAAAGPDFQPGTNLMTLFFYLDYYERGKDRIGLVRSIRDAHVHIFGDINSDLRSNILGWKDYLKDQPNVTIHPPVPFQETFEILKKSKISLNSSPFFRNGSHERVFNAIVCGALALSSESLYLRETLPEGSGLQFYQINGLEDVNGQVNAILKDEKSRCRQVRKGQEIIQKHHTWDCRAGELIKEASSLILKMGK